MIGIPSYFKLQGLVTSHMHCIVVASLSKIMCYSSFTITTKRINILLFINWYLRNDTDCYVGLLFLSVI